MEVDRNVLRQRNIGPESLTQRARVFGDRFNLVAGPADRVWYESKRTFQYGKRRDEVTNDLSDLFDASLIISQRYGSDRTHYLILSKRVNLMSQEAMTFAVVHHMSNMVRYRPQHAEKLRGTRYFWLFASRVDRACENFLLAMASRITREEHRIV